MKEVLPVGIAGTMGNQVVQVFGDVAIRAYGYKGILRKVALVHVSHNCLILLYASIRVSFA